MKGADVSWKVTEPMPGLDKFFRLLPLIYIKDDGEFSFSLKLKILCECNAAFMIDFTEAEEEIHQVGAWLLTGQHEGIPVARLLYWPLSGDGRWDEDGQVPNHRNKPCAQVVTMPV